MAEKSGGRTAGGAERVLKNLKETVAAAHTDAPDADRADVLVARASTLPAMLVVALLTMDTEDCQFSGARSRKLWDEAVAILCATRREVISTLQTRMGPASAAILLAKVAAAICETNHLDGAKMARLFGHFASDPGAPGSLPIEQVLDLGASLSRQMDEGDETSDYDEP